MNQIMPVGKGVLIAIEQKLTVERFVEFTMAWKERLPDVPVFVVNEAQIVQSGEVTLFQFTGEVTPTLVAEFQRWWEEVSRGTD